MDKLQRLKQRNTSVKEYRQKMKLYMMKAGIREKEVIKVVPNQIK